MTFTSSSTVTSFVKNFTRAQRRRLFSRTRALSIGPITSRALRAGDIRPQGIRPQGIRPQGIRPLQARGAATVENLAAAVVRALRDCHYA